MASTKGPAQRSTTPRVRSTAFCPPTARRLDSLLGVGLYSVAEAAHLLREPTQRVRRWTHGYTFRRSGSRPALAARPDEAPLPHLRLSPRLAPVPDAQVESVARPPVVTREMAAQGPEIITFLDLIELFFVAMFYNEGVPLAYIRRAAETAGREFASDHPFAVRQFETDGRRIFAVVQGGPGVATHTQELADAQYVFDEQVRPFFRDKVECDVESVSRFWPLGRQRCVVLDPARSFGKPIDSASGIPTRTLYQAYLAGEEPQAIAEWYEIPAETVECAVEYEQSLTA